MKKGRVSSTAKIVVYHARTENTFSFRGCRRMASLLSSRITDRNWHRDFSPPSSRSSINAQLDPIILLHSIRQRFRLNRNNRNRGNFPIDPTTRSIPSPHHWIIDHVFTRNRKEEKRDARIDLIDARRIESLSRISSPKARVAEGLRFPTVRRTLANAPPRNSRSRPTRNCAAYWRT